MQEVKTQKEDQQMTLKSNEGHNVNEALQACLQIDNAFKVFTHRLVEPQQFISLVKTHAEFFLKNIK